MGDHTWLIGVGLAVLAGVVSNMGLNMQKLTHVRLVEAAAMAREAAARAEDEEAARAANNKSPGEFERIWRVSERDEESASAAAHTPSYGAVSSDDDEPSEATPTLKMPRPRPGTSAELPRLSLLMEDDYVSRAAPMRRASIDVFHDTDSEYAYAAAAGTRLPAKARQLTDRMMVKVPAPPQPPGGGQAEPAEPALKAYYWQPLWMCGFALVILGSLLDFVALAFAAQSIVAPLGAVTLVVNLLLAPFFSGEEVTRTDVKATVLIVAGSAGSVLFGPHGGDGDYTFDEYFAFFTRWRAVVYYGVVLTTISFLTGIFEFLDTLREDLRTATNPRVVSARRRLKSVMRIILGAVAGLVGAQSVLFAKGFATLVSIGVLNMWLHYGTYVIVGGLILSVNGQIMYLNRGLARYDALGFVPVFEAFWIGGGVIAGIAVLDEASGFSRDQTLCFGAGVLVTLAGVSVLAGRKGSRNEDRFSDLGGLSPRSEAGSDLPVGDSPLPSRSHSPRLEKVPSGERPRGDRGSINGGGGGGSGVVAGGGAADGDAKDPMSRPLLSPVHNSAAAGDDAA